jgi:ABC-type multidrug transport system ATPase subunit
VRDRRAAFEHAVAALPNRASRLQPLVSLSHLQPLRSFRYPAARRFVCRGPLLNPQCDDGALGALEEEHDDDVAAEEARLRGGDSSGALRVLGLRKVYAKRDARNRRTKFSAVKDLWFAIPKGEVFGFLGVNGAGKSTTLKMLSGDVIPTSGTAEMGGFDILNEQVAVRRLLGYCPQTNAILPLLTVREHLHLFARIKGVPWREVAAVVARRIEQLDLGEFTNKLAGTLSGGNKRKLCVAIALIGEPPIVFLDEPSAGMDPVAKRFMWNLIASLSGGGGAQRTNGARASGEGGACTIVLTTHSMEECTALCTKIGIMVDGGLRCLGTEQHLKTKFGHGFQAQFMLCDASANAVEVMCASLDAAALLSQPGASRLFSAVRVTRALSAGITRTTPASTPWLSESRGGGGSGDDDGSATQPLSLVGGVVQSAAVDAACALLASQSRASGVLGAQRRAKLIGDGVENGSGWLLAQKLRTQGFVSAEALAGWWLTEDRIDRLDAFMRDAFKGCALIETHGGSCRYYLPPGNTSLGAAFGLIEAAKESVGVSEYALSETTLEQIFLSFAARQQDERARAKGMRGLSVASSGEGAGADSEKDLGQ